MEGEEGSGGAGWCLCKYKVHKFTVLSFPITVEEELGHMEGKKVLEDLVGACAIMNNLK